LSLSTLQKKHPKKQKQQQQNKQPKYKKGINLGPKNNQWKGNKAGYSAIHEYIRLHKPKPDNCEVCKKPSKYLDLANINPNRNTAKYTRNLNDYLWLDRKCHMLQDKRLNRFFDSEAQSKVGRYPKLTMRKDHSNTICVLCRSNKTGIYKSNNYKPTWHLFGPESPKPPKRAKNQKYICTKCYNKRAWAKTRKQRGLAKV
jgi:hypothetical protein